MVISGCILSIVFSLGAFVSWVAMASSRDFWIGYSESQDKENRILRELLDGQKEELEARDEEVAELTESLRAELRAAVDGLQLNLKKFRETTIAGLNSQLQESRALVESLQGRLDVKQKTIDEFEAAQTRMATALRLSTAARKQISDLVNNW